jgi:hypothetical protein
MSTSVIAKTPEPPYFAVIFSHHSALHYNGYDEMGKMIELASGTGWLSWFRKCSQS